jgi:ribosomal protein S18 acetylase RimI-like enzyme
MFIYKTLENISIEILHQAFISAFSDYQVKIDLPLWKFEQMLQRRGYVSEISIGAFKDDVLVGFVLNGFRKWDGRPTVYDLGTGVTGEYRKQGITSNILLNLRELLKEKGVEQYLLEVIQTNISAVELYKKQGFGKTRDFVCFQLDKSKYIPMTAWEVGHIDRINSEDWEKLMGFWDFIPSWQNSIDSVNAASDSFVYSIVQIDGTIAGYGIIDRKTGDIPQIAVDRNYRRRGIAGSIITDLIENTESHRIGVLNVDNQSRAMKDFLTKSGFENTVDQYEMILKL